MPADSYGVIVEGEYDSAVYVEIMPRLASHPVHVIAFQCEGRPNLMRKFPGLLEALKYEWGGGPVDMAIVIADADGRDPSDVELQMRSKVAGREYPFEVHFYAVQQAVEAWLLADADALSRVVVNRRGKRLERTHDRLEDLLDPKSMMRGLLSDNRVAYTSAVGAEIAREINFRVLSERCPRFRLFAQLVDC